MDIKLTDDDQANILYSLVRYYNTIFKAKHKEQPNVFNIYLNHTEDNILTDKIIYVCCEGLCYVSVSDYGYPFAGNLTEHDVYQILYPLFKTGETDLNIGKLLKTYCEENLDDDMHHNSFEELMDKGGIKY